MSNKPTIYFDSKTIDVILKKYHSGTAVKQIADSLGLPMGPVCQYLARTKASAPMQLLPVQRIVPFIHAWQRGDSRAQIQARWRITPTEMTAIVTWLKLTARRECDATVKRTPKPTSSPRNRPFVSPHAEAITELYQKEKLMPRAIAKQLGIHRSTVCKFLKRTGLATHSKFPGRPMSQTPPGLIEDRRTGKYTLKELSRKHGMAASTISVHLKRHAIKHKELDVYRDEERQRVKTIKAKYKLGKTALQIAEEHDISVWRVYQLLKRDI